MILLPVSSVLDGAHSTLLEVTVFPKVGMSEAWSPCGDLSIPFEAEATFGFVIIEKCLTYF